jgi:hypothetical protein
MTRLFFAIVLLTISTMTALADEKAPTKKQTSIEAAYGKQRVLFSKFQVAQREVFKDADLIKLRKAWTEATAALNKKIESLSVKERQVEKTAHDALYAQIADRIASSKEIAKLNEKRQSLQKKKRDSQFEIGLISVRLFHNDSPLQQTLDADPSIKSLKEALRNVTREERSTAYNKYNASRRAKLETLKDAKPLFAETEELKKQIAQCDKDNYQALKAISDAKRKIEYGEDKSLQPLRDKLTAARNTTRKVYFHADAKDLRNAVNSASLAYRKKSTELTLASDELKGLQEQLNAVNKEIRDLRPKKKNKPM